jgi:hypothetical protein
MKKIIAVIVFHINNMNDEKLMAIIAFVEKLRDEPAAQA